MKAAAQTPVALTIAGSDSGGGAGIQADLKTFHSLGVFGTCAITAITCQNPHGISAVQAVTPRIVAGQIDQVLAAFPVRAAKTGMLYDAAIIKIVASRCRAHHLKQLVIDPVLVATSGRLLLKREAIHVLQSKLFPLAQLVTPNLAEAELFWQRPIRSVPDLRAAAQALSETHGVAILVKGGHLRSAKRSVDVLYDGHRLHEFSAPHIPGIRTHGTGCTLSAAITAHLAAGHDLVEAVGRAKVFVTRAIRDALRVGRHRALAT
jgi:hydroxymethylpyrimidine/phosphomethylpyrimidine kinase